MEIFSIIFNFFASILVPILINTVFMIKKLLQGVIFKIFIQNQVRNVFWHII